jgi:ABC-type uncharacterized transport system auxiliary subunit
MKHKIALSALSLCLGILNGCGAARPSKYYQLTVPGDTTPVADPSPYPVTLLLGPITTSHLYRDDRIVYSSGGQNMGTYEYQRWAEPPTEMINNVLLRQLRASGRYRAVYSLRSNIHGDYLLHGHLYDFKEVSGGKLAARVTLELELRETKTGATVWTHFYAHDEPVSGKDVSGVVAAIDRNVQQGVNEIRAGIDQYFSTHLPGNSKSAQ